MSLIDKAYFTLEEIEERWQLPHRDVVYLAENGLLKLSVRLFNVRLEWGEFEDFSNGHWNRIPTDQRWFSGLQDLREHDAFRLFRDGEAQIDQFAMPEEHHYCHLRDRSQPPALWFLERARAFVSISRKETTVILEPLARVGAGEPGAQQGGRKSSVLRPLRISRGHGRCRRRSRRTA